MIRNFYADMKRHDLGPAFYERNYDGTLTTHFMTEPLWGVGQHAAVWARWAQHQPA